MKIELIKNAEILDLDCHRGWCSDILILDIKIKNKGSDYIKDFTIIGSTEGKSGTIIGYLYKTIYDRIDGNKIKVFRNIKMGIVDKQVFKLRCSLHKIIEEEDK